MNALENSSSETTLGIIYNSAKKNLSYMIPWELCNFFGFIILLKNCEILLILHIRCELLIVLLATATECHGTSFAAGIIQSLVSCPDC